MATPLPAQFGWIDQCRQVPLEQIFPELGMSKAAGKSWGPCPCCGAQQRHKSDKRGPIYVGTKINGWVCMTCGVKGDTLTAVSYAIHSNRTSDLTAKEMASVQDWFASHGWCAERDDESTKAMEAVTVSAAARPQKKTNQERNTSFSKPKLEPDPVDTARHPFKIGKFPGVSETKKPQQMSPITDGLLVQGKLKIQPRTQDELRAAKADAIRAFKSATVAEQTGLAARYPGKDAVLAIWDACFPVHQRGVHSVDLEVIKFFKARGWSPDALADTDVARLSPNENFAWPEWWPRGRAAKWRLMTLAYKPDGEPVSMHARLVVQASDAPKVLWPKDHDAVGLIMAERVAVNMMRGDSQPDRLIICEGITDLCSVSMAKKLLPGSTAVIACANGGFQAIGKMNIPKKTAIYIGTDADDAGKRYAAQISDALPSRMLKIIPMDKLK